MSDTYTPTARLPAMPRRRSLLQTGFLLVCSITPLTDSATTTLFADDDRVRAVRFDTQVLPILQQACFRCHSDKQRKGELDLRSPQAMQRGGNTGAAIEPGQADESLLIQMIESGEMPPPKEEVRVSREELDILKAWINAGAPGAGSDAVINAADRSFWSFVRPVKAPVPRPEASDRVRTPVDAFVLERLEAAGLAMNPDVNRRVLIRRLSFDLRGLPPASEEIETFLNDASEHAYARLVDEMLASPHYGERWGRHWLDVVGYADSNGRRLDEERRWAWRYRDYVIDAINSDKPYDHFIVQQLAGDELLDWRSAPTLSPEMVENLIATGCLRTAPDASDTSGVAMVDDYYITLQDTVEITVNALLGLTIGCAKCHSHKYDPIPQSDFYRLAACFAPAYNPETWIPANHRGVEREERLRYLKEAAPKELAADAAVNEPLDKAIAALKASLKELKAWHTDRLRMESLAKLPPEVQSALAKPRDERTPSERELAARYPSILGITDKQLEADDEYQRAMKSLESAITAADAARVQRPLIWALWDLAPRPPQTRVLIRGDLRTPGRAVEPGVLSILDDPEHPFEMQPPSSDARTTGYRSQLARWIASERNPLTARVIVNRVWHHHFGRGLVATVNDFGTTGAPPTHPELLDWLAVDFMEHGWSLKHLHRRIVLSSVYRQSGAHDENKAQSDPENLLWWRKPPMRLEAEAIRDTALALSGKLNPQMYGPGVPVEATFDGQWIAAGDGFSANRRSIYLLNKRTESVTFLTTFGAPVMELDCPERFRATVVQQSLAMLNNPFVVEQAKALALRIAAAAPRDQNAAIRWSFEHILGRSPEAREVKIVSQLLESGPAAAGGETVARADPFFHLAHTLLNTNEFLYID